MRELERRSFDGGYPPIRSKAEPELRQIVGDDVYRTVAEHNATHVHLTWRRRAGNAPTAVVDVSFGASGRSLP